jgi:LysM repeat protein
MKLKFLSFFIGLFIYNCVQAQTISIEEYIFMYKEIAMKEMIRSGVPAAITIAQGIVETENGNSKLVKKSNNHFGIKCKETWTGPSVSHDDDAPGECFRKYSTAEESYIDHSNFLVTRKHYSFLFSLDPADYKAWAYGLKRAGYATNPKYPEMLIKYIETYNLNEYSLIALGRKKADESTVVNTDLPQSPVKQQSIVTVPVKMNPEAGQVVVVQKPIVQPEVKKPAVNYPTGEFKINETRVTFVTKGTSFLSIAQQYNLPLKWLYDFNDVKETEAVENDQLVYLQRKRKVGANATHVVSDGETLYTIAQEQGIRLDALMQLNFLTVNQQPAAGEQLYLQSPAPGAPKLSTKKNNAAVTQLTNEIVPVNNTKGKTIHAVQPKETLYSISKKYEVSLSALQQWNQLNGTELKEGTELIILK